MPRFGALTKTSGSPDSGTTGAAPADDADPRAEDDAAGPEPELDAPPLLQAAAKRSRNEAERLVRERMSTAAAW